MTHIRTAVVSIISALVAATVVCCASATPTVKRVAAVACEDIVAIEALTISVEVNAGASEATVQATHVAFAALRAVCAASAPAPASK